MAIADHDDVDHAACRALLEGDHDPLLTTPLVIAEAAYLIDRQLDTQAEAALYDSVIDAHPARRGSRPHRFGAHS